MRWCWELEIGGRVRDGCRWKAVRLLVPSYCDLHLGQCHSIIWEIGNPDHKPKPALYHLYTDLVPMQEGIERGKSHKCLIIAFEHWLGREGKPHSLWKPYRERRLMTYVLVHCAQIWEVRGHGGNTWRSILHAEWTFEWEFFVILLHWTGIKVTAIVIYHKLYADVTVCDISQFMQGKCYSVGNS